MGAERRCRQLEDKYWGHTWSGKYENGSFGVNSWAGTIDKLRDFPNRIILRERVNATLPDETGGPHQPVQGEYGTTIVCSQIRMCRK